MFIEAIAEVAMQLRFTQDVELGCVPFEFITSGIRQQCMHMIAAEIKSTLAKMKVRNFLQLAELLVTRLAATVEADIRPQFIVTRYYLREGDYPAASVAELGIYFILVPEGALIVPVAQVDETGNNGDAVAIAVYN